MEIHDPDHHTISNQSLSIKKYFSKQNLNLLFELSSTYKNKTSYYIYFDVDDYDYYDFFSVASVARLKSPRIDGNIAQCLGFW